MRAGGQAGEQAHAPRLGDDGRHTRQRLERAALGVYILLGGRGPAAERALLLLLIVRPPRRGGVKLRAAAGAKRGRAAEGEGAAGRRGIHRRPST